MNHTSLLIAPDAPKRKPRKVIARRSPKNFSLSLDQLTHDTLVHLQKTLSSPKLAPSRTLVTREAIRRYGQEVRTRLAHGDREWIEAETTALTGLAFRGPK